MNLKALLQRLVCLAFLSLACSSALAASDATEPKLQPPHGRDYFILRGGLDNCRWKFEHEKKGRVVFLGGSITHMNGWREMVCEKLKRRFPGTEFDFIDAGIPSTGSTPGAFRFSRDVLAHGPVDLLFEEAAVNDETNGQTPVEQLRGMEGIVRQARMANPLTDIVILYFVQASALAAIHSGHQPEVVLNHEKVAVRYAVPSLNLVQEMAERIDAGEFTWEDKIKSEHPTPFGQRLYANAVERLFAAAWSAPLAENATPKPHSLPTPVDPASYYYGRLLKPSAAQPDSNWTLDPDWKPADNAATRPGFVDVPVLVAEKPGASLRLVFEGNAVGVFVVSGPDAGTIEYQIDGAAAGQRDLYTRWSKSLHLPWAQVLAAGLQTGRHELELKISSTKNPQSKGNGVRIVKFLVNGGG